MKNNEDQCKVCQGAGTVINRYIPVCCGFALKEDYSRPGKEWSCPTCNRFYDIFDDYAEQAIDTMTDEQKAIASDRGWKV